MLSDRGKYPTFSSDSTNNGIVGYSNLSPSFLCDQDCPIFVIFGDHTRTFNIAQTSFNVMDNVKVLKPNKKYKLSELLFITSSWKKGIKNLGYARHWKIAKEAKILLPTKNNQIDFDFMESFIAELEAERIAELEAERIAELSAYLKVSGLDNYELSVEELKALRDYDSIDFEEFEYQEVFDKIVQGRRLKKDDQIPGDIPFVMSGVTNTGIVNFISNPVASFPRNSITLDIFGNAFYRPYAYGAGDDTGVYWNEENEYSKEVMLYITSSMSRSVAGKYDYGNKLRSSKSKNIKMKLPAVSKGVLDTDYMRIITNAVMKLVIKDVVQYTNERIETTKEVVTSHNTNY